MQERTEEVLVSEKRFRALVENNEGIISLVDEKLNVFFRSASAARITGWTNEEYNKNNAAQYIHPDDLENLRAAMAEAAANPEKRISILMRVRHYNGNYIWLEGMIKNMLHDPSVRGIITNMRDVTRRREAEQKIIKANRLYFFISQINQMIVRSTDDTTVFKEACKIAVDLGKFSMAWIGMVDEATKKIIPVAYAGEEQGYLSAIKTIAADDIIGSKGPAGIALSKGTYIICNDIENDLRMKHWKNEALSRGYLSCMVIPIKKFEKIAGIFSFYASEKNFFDVAEVTLLEEATGDVSFALEVFEKEALRKKAEATVLESEKRYHTLAEISPVGIFHTNADGFTTYVNPRWCQISGLSAEEALGNGWLKAVHEEDKIKLAKGWEQAVKTHDISFSEYRFIRSDGTTRWVIGQAIPERDPENRIVGYVGTTTDITERKNAEEAIKISNERFEMIARATNDAVFDLNLLTGESWHNQTFLQLFYSDNDTVKVKPDSVQWRAKLHPEDRERVIKKLDAAYEGNSNAWSDEFRFKKADGSYGIFYDRGYITRDLSGKPLRIIGSMTDITAIKKVQEKLKESEEKYRSLIEQASDAIFISDENGIFLDVNESACNMLGYSKAALCTMKIEELYTATELSLRPIMQQELERGERTSIERNMLHKNGSEIPVDITAKMLTDRRIVAIVRDISERKKAEQEIKKSNERFELIAKATHDGIWDWNLATNEVWGNEVHQQLYGLTIADPIPNYEEWKKRIHPDDRERAVKALEEAKTSGKQSYADEYRFYTENTGWMNVYGRTLIERNYEGKPVRLIGSMMDITDRKKAEEAIKISEEKYRSLVEQASDAIFISDTDGRFITVNPSACKISQYTEAELLQMTIFDFFTEEDVRKRPIQFEALKQGLTITSERVMKRKDGGVNYLEITAKLLNDGKILSFVKDVAERKKNEEALKESEEKYRTLVEQASDAIFIADTSGRFVTVNTSACKLSQHSEAELLQMTIYDFALLEDLQREPFHFEELRKGKTVVTERVMKVNEGLVLQIEVTAKLLSDGRLLAFIRDISERVKAQEEIKQTSEKLRQLTAHLQRIREDERKSRRSGRRRRVHPGSPSDRWSTRRP